MPFVSSSLPPRPSLLALVISAHVLLLSAPAAHAYDVEINSETIGQGYQVVEGNGKTPPLSRRRLDQYLGLHVWNLGPKDVTGAPMPYNQWYFTSSFRMQFDFGDWAPNKGEWGARDISAELAQNRLEILYAYVGARDLAGFLDLKLGRQIDYDAFEFLAYDGMNLLAKTPWYLAAEVYGGLLVNGFLPVDSPIFRPDGTAPGALSIHENGLRDSGPFNNPKPVLGVALRTFGYRDLDARLSFRQVFSPGLAAGGCVAGTDIGNLERCRGVKDGTSEQKLAWNARGRLLDGRLVPWLGLRYDLLLSVLDTISAGVRFTIDDKHALTAEYLYSYPTFDGDSIFNLFVRSQFDDVRLGYDLRWGRTRLYARGFVRFFHDVEEAKDRLNPSGPAPEAPGGNLDGGANVGVRYDLGKGYLRADGYVEQGWGGSRIGVDLSTRWAVYRDVLSIEGRALYARFNDDARGNPEADKGDSVGLQVGGRAVLARGILLHVILEDNISRYYASQFRLYALLDVTALLGSSGFSTQPPRGLGGGMGQFGSAYGPGRGY